MVNNIMIDDIDETVLAEALAEMPLAVSQPQPDISTAFNLVQRVKQCYDWATLYVLGTDFNGIGQAIVPTKNGRFILCRMVNGEPQVVVIIDDYVFLGDHTDYRAEIPPRHLDIICDFIFKNAGLAQELIKNVSKGYGQNVALYGKPINIANEDVLREGQSACYVASLMEG